MKIGLPAAISLALGHSTIVQAQSVSGSGLLSDRTGPDAVTDVPEFAEEMEFSRPQTAPPPIAPIKGTVTISSVAVEDVGATPALFRKDWASLTDPASGLKLSYKDNDRLDASWIARQFSENNLVGSDVGLDRIVTLVQLINRAFIANGFINSGVLLDGAPPPDGGALRLNLVSGRLVGGGEKTPGISVKWAENGRNRLSERFIAARMPAAQQAPLDAIAIERQFRLLAENPAIRTVAAELRPGTRPGEAQLALTVDPEPNFDLYVTAANNRSPSIGGERYAVGGAFRNFLRPGDILSVETGRTGGKHDLIAGYEGPFVGTKTIFRARGGFNNAAVIDPQLRPLDIEASDWQAEVGLGYKLIEKPLMPKPGKGGWFSAVALVIGASIAHRESETSLLGRPFSFSPGAVNGKSEYTALRLTGDYVQRGISQVLAVSLTATQGLNGSEGDVPGLIAPDPNFRAARAQVSFARRLTEDGLELRARFAGQYADGILYSGERFGAGGAQTVRGYRETLVLADTGVLGSVELAKSFSLSGSNGARKAFDWGNFTLSAFAEGALLDNREGPAAVPDNIASVGTNVSWTPSPAINAQVSYGYALIDAPRTGSRDLQDRGISFRVTIRPLELLAAFKR